MPIIDSTDYKPPFLFKNGHFNTVYPAFFRKLAASGFTRKRIDTEDHDFIDIDFLQKEGNKKAAFLFHGLEGSTSSQYIKAIAATLHGHGYDIIATNFRGCSGTPNNKITSYHSGFTDDLHLVVNKYADNYDESIIIGYSMGGNASLKYAGEDPNKVHSSVSKVIAVSVPINLSDSSRALERKANYFYTQNFLRTLKEKIIQSDKQFPNQIDLSHLKKIKTIWDYDQYYTAPFYGFEGAEDYYSKSMSLQFLPDIKIEAHIISSLDDPFLTESCFPFAQAGKSKTIFLHAPKYGGHVGFYEKGKSYWIESKIADILGLNLH